MPAVSSNIFPYVHLAPAAAPASPSAGSQRLYLDSGDGNKLKRKDSAGVVTTIEGGSGYTDEQVRDVIGAALVAGSNVTITVNDAGDTITIAAATDAEVVRDTIAAALVAGSGMTITVNDGADTITLASSGGGSTYVGVKVYRSAAYSIADNTASVMAWDAEDWDTDGFHDNVTNNSRLTIPAGLGGKYQVSCGIADSATMSAARYIIGIRKNGSGTGGDTEHGGRADAVSVGSNPGIQVTTVLQLAAGDYIEIFHFQNSGTARAVDTALCGLEMHKIG